MKVTEGKKIYFASDNHLGIPDSRSSLIREKKFVKWLDTIKVDAHSIYLLGDLFDFWFEYKTVVPKGFTRVLGNTTGSHLAGSKNNPYGNLNKFKVDVVPFLEICKASDLIKIDVEGHEAKILLSTNNNDWSNTDAIVEVGNQENCNQIFEHFQNIEINLFSQKKSWERVSKIEDMPNSYKEGSLFISKKEKMPW